MQSNSFDSHRHILQFLVAFFTRILQLGVLLLGLFPTRVAAQFDPQGWRTDFALPGVTGPVSDVVVLGENVVVAGSFFFAGSSPAEGIAEWSRVTGEWSAIGDGFNDRVLALEIDDTGRMFAGGQFTMSGDRVLNHIAQWNGMSWEPLGEGLDGPVSDMRLVGDTLYVAGDFSQAGGNPAKNVALWTSGSWHALGEGIIGAVSSLAVLGKQQVFLAGSFESAGTVSVHNLALWDGERWSDVGGGTDESIQSMVVVDTTLIIAGRFSRAGAVDVDRAARWDGIQWSPYELPVEEIGWVTAIQACEDGRFYTAGEPLSESHDNRSAVMMFDGSSWIRLNTDMDIPFDVYSLTCLEEGLIVGGDVPFIPEGGNPSNFLLKYERDEWGVLGDQQTGGLTGIVRLMAQAGEVLVVAGDFYFAGTTRVNKIAFREGSTWQAMGAGVTGTVFDLATDGEDVFVLGDFVVQGSNPSEAIVGAAIWNAGTHTWRAMGVGIDGRASRLANDPEGTVWVNGGFMGPGNSIQTLAMWDGDAWRPITEPIPGEVQELFAGADGVYVGTIDDATLENPVAQGWRWTGASLDKVGPEFEAVDLFALAADETELYVSALVPLPFNVVEYRLLRLVNEEWVTQLAQAITNDLLIHEDGSLFAGGAYGLRRWDGGSWNELGVRGDVNAITMDEKILTVGGDFRRVRNTDSSDGIPSSNIGQWYVPSNIAHEPSPTPMLPSDMTVIATFPNPFSSEITIRYAVHETGNVVYDLYNSMGQHVETYAFGFKTPGTYERSIDTSDRMASGLYFVCIANL